MIAKRPTRRGLPFVLLIGWLVTTAAPTFAAVASFAIDTDKAIAVGVDTTIRVRALDEKGEPAADDRLVRVEIFDGASTRSEDILLKGGRADIPAVFPNQGASMVTVSDVENPAVVNYGAFVVTLPVEVSK